MSKSNPAPAAAKRTTAKKVAAAKKPAAKKVPAKPKAEKVTLTAADALKALAAYLTAEGSSEYSAPVDRKPFVYGERVYFTLKGLTAHNDLPTAALKSALGAEHNPFPVKVDGKQTSISHFFVPAKKVPGAAKVKPRMTAREAKAQVKA